MTTKYGPSTDAGDKATREALREPLNNITVFKPGLRVQGATISELMTLEAYEELSMKAPMFEGDYYNYLAKNLKDAIAARGRK